MALADWDEFEAITGERRLTRAVSLDIINWARTAPADPFMAEALHRVVRLNKHESGGLWTGSLLEKSPLKLCTKNSPIRIGQRKHPIGGSIGRVSLSLLQAISPLLYLKQFA